MFHVKSGLVLCVSLNLIMILSFESDKLANASQFHPINVLRRMVRNIEGVHIQQKLRNNVIGHHITARQAETSDLLSTFIDDEPIKNSMTKYKSVTDEVYVFLLLPQLRWTQCPPIRLPTTLKTTARTPRTTARPPTTISTPTPTTPTPTTPTPTTSTRTTPTPTTATRTTPTPTTSTRTTPTPTTSTRTTPTRTTPTRTTPTRTTTPTTTTPTTTTPTTTTPTTTTPTTTTPTTTTTPSTSRSTTTPSRVCRRGFTRLGNKCYHFSNDSKMWNESRDTCRAMNSEFAHPNEAEDKILTDHLRSISGASPSNWWIGGNDIEKEGEYVWDHDKSNIRYLNWNLASGEPMGARSPIEDCIHYWDLADYKWNDINCDRSFRYICEYRLP